MTEFTDQDQQEVEALVNAALPWLRYQAESELLRRQRRIRAVSVSQINAAFMNWIADRMHAQAEAGFRKGYTHGFSDGMDAVLLESGPHETTKSAWQRVCEFFDGPLMAWRYRRGSGREPAPAYKNTATQEAA